MTTPVTPKQRPTDAQSVDTLVHVGAKVYPYPKWYSVAERSFLAASVTLTLILSIVGIVLYKAHDIPVGAGSNQLVLIPIMLGCSLGFISNNFSLYLLWRDKYGPKGYWVWNTLGDAIIGGTCLVGFVIFILEPDSDSNGKSWSPMTIAIMTFSLITGVGHEIADFAGFYGIHLVSKRGAVAGAAQHDDIRV